MSATSSHKRSSKVAREVLSGFGNENLIVSFLLAQRYESRSSRMRQNLQAIRLRRFWRKNGPEFNNVT